MNIFLVLSLIAVFATVYLLNKAKQTQQLNYIEQYRFHHSITNKLAQKYPQLTQSQLDMVFQCLKDFFRVCHKAKKRNVAMPSQVVDVAWHEFILFTRSYDLFCKKALGYYLHHTPAAAMATPTSASEGIKRAWRLACELAKINPKHPDRLPQLFAVDSVLEIDNGFVYRLNCTLTGVGGFCVSDINCCSDGGGDGGGGDNSGCSGGGDCGSGCGGGGD